MEQDLWRVPLAPGYSAEPKPASGLGPSGEYPSRDELRELLKRAAPLPWERPWNDASISSAEAVNERGAWRMQIYDEGGHDEHDAALIVAAVNSLPHLLDALDNLERENRRLREAVAALSPPA